ncbi:hypothetical protein KR038_009058 [Drosophila bunnanda]|nr:hypothetical protein KR038_009058 [Drosophila bunnanda]
MFRLQQSQPDPAEEKKRVAAEVRFNFILFGTLIAAIRLGTVSAYVKCPQLIIFLFPTAPVVLQHLNTA